MITPADIAKHLAVRIAGVPVARRSDCPAVMFSPDSALSVFFSDKHIFAVFLTPEDQQRISDCAKRNIDPFIGLVSFPPGPQGPAIVGGGGRNSMFSGCTAHNLYTFAHPKDLSAVLVNHTVQLDNTDVGPIAYTIPLGFLIVYGDSITPSNWLGAFSELTAKAFDQWLAPND